MKESLMLKTALFISILGIVSLFIINRNIEISSTTIEKINHEKIQGDVKVSGYIKDIKSSDKFTSLIISQESEIKAIAYSKLNLTKGQYVEIIGNYAENSLIIDVIKTKDI